MDSYYQEAPSTNLVAKRKHMHMHMSSTKEPTLSHSHPILVKSAHTRVGIPPIVWIYNLVLSIKDLGYLGLLYPPAGSSLRLSPKTHDEYKTHNGSLNNYISF